MKKFNKNILLFIFFVAFVICGLWGNCFGQIRTEISTLVANLKQGNWRYIFISKENVDNISSEQLSYHSALVDINSVKDNIMGTKVCVEKYVAKSESDSLIKRIDELSSEQIHDAVMAISRLKDVAEGSGANFLYCAVSNKEYYEKAPENFPVFENQNYDEFIKQLSQENIPYINLNEYFEASDIDGQDIYYKTDHHWKTCYGLVATNAIVKELNERYNISFQDEYTDINNYKVENYPDWFLGSYGKKLGTYFTWGGTDDFDLITPIFNTNFSEKSSLTDQTKTGTFYDIMLNTENLKKNLYGVSTYNTYAATNKQRVRVVKNMSEENNGKKVLIVQTSFGQVVSPFLAIQCQELHICDVRTNQGIVDPAIDLEDYINETNPDVVLVLYNSVSKLDSSSNLYDFFND